MNYVCKYLFLWFKDDRKFRQIILANINEFTVL